MHDNPGGDVAALSATLTASLVDGDGMSDCLHRFLEAIGTHFGASRMVLFDYDERGSHFELLFFNGYPENARSELSRRTQSAALRSATHTRDPYVLDAEARELAVPLHFMDTLEAVLVLRRDEGWTDRAALLPAARVISRFLGLFMSSSRLPVNVAQHAAAAEDLVKAREVQLAYLPEPHLRTDRYEIFGHNRSSALVGGDYYDYFRHRPNAVQGVVADACGHGMSAALIMSTFRGLLHSEVPHGDDIAPALGRFNRRLFRGGDRLQYLTGVMFDFNEHDGLLRYSNAGHFDPVIVHRDGSVTSLEGGGPPLGMFQASAYPLGTAGVEPDDVLVLFTDGLVELASPSGEFFEVHRIIDVVREARSRPLREISDAVVASAMDFRGRDDLADDLTLFMMRFH